MGIKRSRACAISPRHTICICEYEWLGICMRWSQKASASSPMSADMDIRCRTLHMHNEGQHASYIHALACATTQNVEHWRVSLLAYIEHRDALFEWSVVVGAETSSHISPYTVRNTTGQRSNGSMSADMASATCRMGAASGRRRQRVCGPAHLPHAVSCAFLVPLMPLSIDRAAAATAACFSVRVCVCACVCAGPMNGYFKQHIWESNTMLYPNLRDYCTADLRICAE